MLGLPATGRCFLLGNTSDGAAISAELASNGLYVTVTDLTANTTTTTQLSNSQNPGYFSAASLRNNGIYDLVETGLTDPVTSAAATAVFLGNGDGTFKPPVYYDVSDNGLGEFTIDDVTGDGIPDIVELTTTGLAIANVTTLIGKGDGTFTIGPVSAVTGVPSDQPVTGVFKTGDVKDLLVGGTVLFGSGNGSFTVGPTNTAIASATNYLFPGAVGSLRNNGKLDVVVTQPGFVSIYYGNGDGTFTTGPSYAALPDYMQVTITDVDGDGNPDIVLGTSTGGDLHRRRTTIADAHVPDFDGAGRWHVCRLAGLQPGNVRRSRQSKQQQLEIASGNFTGNGNLDVLVFGQSNNGGTASSLLMLPGNGTGALGAPVTSSINICADFLGRREDESRHPAGCGARRLQSQRISSIVRPCQPGQWNIRRGTGLRFARRSRQPGGGRFQWRRHSGRRSGRVIGRRRQRALVYVLLGQANGTLGAPVQIDSSLNPTGLAAGSLTTDGRTDLVVADQGAFNYVGSSQQINGALHVYLGNANGTFTTVAAPTTTATNYTVAALGDLNNDGKLDLIVAGTIAGTSIGTAHAQCLHAARQRRWHIQGSQHAGARRPGRHWRDLDCAGRRQQQTAIWAWS